MVLPSLCLASRSQVALLAYGSIPDVGSSSTTVLDPPIRAMPTLCMYRDTTSTKCMSGRTDFSFFPLTYTLTTYAILSEVFWVCGLWHATLLVIALSSLCNHAISMGFIANFLFFQRDECTIYVCTYTVERFLYSEIKMYVLV